LEARHDLNPLIAGIQVSVTSLLGCQTWYITSNAPEQVPTIDTKDISVPHKNPNPHPKKHFTNIL